MDLKHPQFNVLSIDQALTLVGEYGAFQRRVVWLNGCLMFFLAFQQLQNVFVAAEPEFVCAHGVERTSRCPEDVNIKCDMYIFTGKDFTSIASEWDLVCEQAYKASAVQSVLMAGLFVGCLLCGSWSDKYGRKNLYCLCFLAIGVFSFFGSFAPHYSLYLACRFITGFFIGGIGIISFVLCSELIGSSHRGFIGLFFPIMFAIGIALYSLIAYYIRDWRMLSVVTSLPALIVFYLYKLLPESPRWLHSKGRRLEAEQALHKISAMNRPYSPVPEFSLHECEMPAGKQQSGLKDILTHRVLKRRFLINLPIWFVFSAVYYGMTISAGSLGGSMYINVALSGLSEIPAYVGAMYILNKLGRRITLSLTLCLAGVPCLGILCIPEEAAMAGIVLGLIGKMFVSIAFSVGYIYTAELFPTTLRNQALGLCSTAARLGGIVAPMLGSLNFIHPSMEFLVYGIMSVLAGSLALTLPDTTGKTLPENMDDLEHVHS